MFNSRGLLLFSILLAGACDCGSGFPTTDHMCVNEGDCESGELCIDSICRTSGCEVGGNDCTLEEICVDSVCLPGGMMCEAGVCPSGQMCVDDRCVMEVCIDPDMDGYGPGCVRGEDCDPADMLQTGHEVCDGRDNDCDGVADNGVLSECGDCDPDCRLGGVGGDDPFMPDDMNSDGVGVAEDGALELDSRRVNTNFIWIANTPQGTISRFSTTAPYPEVGRYRTGTDPSRTSVNSLGDAYVGNRAGNSLTRISVLGMDCPDTNGDGVITTSQDTNGDGVISGAELLAPGEDDCVLWNTNLAVPGLTLIRAVAAQDVAGPDGELQHFVWVGGYSSNTIAKIDGETGNVLFTTAAPSNPYGFALDGSGRLWIASYPNATLHFVDTTRCLDVASCAAAVCVASSAEATNCDTAVKATIPAPHQLYGITVDFDQRVWVGGGNISRYNIAQPSGSRWATASGVRLGGIAVHGIAADADGIAWGAGQGNGVYRVDPVSMVAGIVTGTAGTSNKGMAVDSDGKIWSITQSNEAVVITPGAGLMDTTAQRNVASSIVTPYTYSDMTGLQLRLATNPRGYYRHIFEGCGEASAITAWGDVRFSAETPTGTNVVFRVRTADTRDALDSADWTVVGMAPPDTSPLDISSALEAAGVEPLRFLMLEMILSAERSSSTEVITPRIMSVDVTHSCPPIIG